MAENIIMAVDDSPTVTKFVSFTLRAGGFKVYTACDGMDALEKLSNIEGSVDLVITDLNMPNIDGYELIRTLKANEKYRDTPVIILSSEENEEDIERGKQAGASSYLIKPFKPDVLLTEVGKYLKAKQPV
ncbi:MAG: response regulator [candidate division Zixibacteria bacterium]|jgi:two-component system chemotaxis response regulator CheY|nr:response regulator [candidate division Zixibacteria bacterium]